MKVWVMVKMLFICVGNSGRSQMAEAFAKKLGAGKMVAESAGTKPSAFIDPTVAAVMKEIGYDLGGQHPKALTMEMVDSADRIFSMGCGAEEGTCPVTFVPSENWELEDPKDQPIEKVREIRDQIRRRIERLVADLP